MRYFFSIQKYIKFFFEERDRAIHAILPSPARVCGARFEFDDRSFRNDNEIGSSPSYRASLIFYPRSSSVIYDSWLFLPRREGGCRQDYRNQIRARAKERIGRISPWQFRVKYEFSAYWLQESREYLAAISHASRLILLASCSIEIFERVNRKQCPRNDARALERSKWEEACFLLCKPSRFSSNIFCALSHFLLFEEKGVLTFQFRMFFFSSTARSLAGDRLLLD